MSGKNVKNWNDVYTGQWRFDGISYVWAGSLKGGECTPAMIRGYGYLTGGGHGALGLSDEDAARIQKQVGTLLAAAPDLLEALQRLVTINAEYVEFCEPGSAYDQARIAIARATGDA